MADLNESDIIQILQESEGVKSGAAESLEDLDKTMKEVLKRLDRMSQAAIFDKQSKRDQGIFSSKYNDRTSARAVFNGARSGLKGGVQQGIYEAIGMGDIKRELNSTFKRIAKDIGVSVEDLPTLIGRELGKQFMSRLPKRLTDAIKGKITNLGQKVTGSISSAYDSARSAAHQANVDSGAYRMESLDMSGGQSDSGKTATQAAKAIGEMAKMGQNAEGAAKGMEAVSEVSGALSGSEALAMEEGLAGLAGGVEALIPIIASAGPIILAGMVAFAALKPAIEGAKKAAGALSNAFNRSRTSITKGLEQANERLKKDVETLVKTPFEIMNKAAEEWYSTWDNNLRTITATQGYNKSQLQDLMASFAERLREDNLTDVVSATDLTNNLKSVLEQGLSGTVAEEFSYIATVLNAAIPTQDFFGYAGTYASIAANAIRNGKSESEAIAEANEQLTAFANNLLYASRSIAGGFTTGLKNAENLFTQSVQIAQAGRSGNTSAIAGVMTAVSAITGAIAPDLASAMTDAIYKAAVGGNSSEIVALRSLAGINASNTEFLRQLAEDPQKVFTNLFRELANRQSMSDDAYMEVAEGLSSVFGVSADAFARVDFAYLADAIENMNTSSSALLENMSLLKSGETTTTAEQLKMQQINKQILDEGLSYVLDNEAARAIQQHMWDEQLAREMQETTYSVEVKGALLQFVEGIAHAVETILTIINPLMWFSKIADVGSTIEETYALEQDIAQALELGKVGNGNAYQKYLLTTRNMDLNVADNYISLLGGTSKFAQSEADRLAARDVAGVFDANLIINTQQGKTASDFEKAFTARNISSLYNFGMVGKSQAAIGIPSGKSSATAMSSMVSDTVRAQEKTNQKIDDMLASMSEYVENSPSSSYEEWIKTSRQYGISDFGAALEDAGLTGETVKGQYERLQAQLAGQQEGARRETEETFWRETTDYNAQQVTYLTSIYDQQIITHDLVESQMEVIISHTQYLLGIYDAQMHTYDAFTEFVDAWKSYFIDHSVYKDAYNSAEVERISREERNENQTAVLALADALTKNDVNLLVDPTLQTNALLSSILQTAIAILNATNTPNGNAMLADSLAGLALGVSNTR